MPALQSETPDPLKKKLIPVLSKVVEVLGEKGPSTAPASPKIQVEVAVEVAVDAKVEVVADGVVVEAVVKPAESPNLSACAVRLAISSRISLSRGL